MVWSGKMKTCVFFGHRDFNYRKYQDKLAKILLDLVDKEGFTQFYSGGRGAFDLLCAETVFALRSTHPNIKNTLVFSYLPPANADFTLPEAYTDSVYLLEKQVPPRYAVSRTNKCMVDKADCLIVGIVKEWGGAWAAVEYAQKRGKRIINICE